MQENAAARQGNKRRYGRLAMPAWAPSQIVATGELRIVSIDHRVGVGWVSRLTDVAQAASYPGHIMRRTRSESVPPTLLTLDCERAANDGDDTAAAAGWLPQRDSRCAQAMQQRFSGAAA